MRDLRIPRGVYTSTLAIFGDTHGFMPDETYIAEQTWLSEYDRTKWAAHYEVAEPMIRAGLPLVIVQPGVVYGPGDPSSMGDTLRAYLHRDQIHHRLRARRHARISALTSGGAIPEMADYRVVTEGDNTFVGTFNEDFAIETQSGNVFQLGNVSWRILYVRGGEVTVRDAHGAPAA